MIRATHLAGCFLCEGLSDKGSVDARRFENEAEKGRRALRWLAPEDPP